MTTDTPAPPTHADIVAAASRIGGTITRTPLEPAPYLSEVAGVPVYLKLECWQRTRSFKLRGAYNAIAAMSAADRARGIVTASAGNHGQAVALAASILGANATVFVPSNSPEVKKTRIRSYGAALNDTAATYDEAEVAAVEHGRSTGQYFVHAFSDDRVVAGQGTIALEIMESLPAVAHVITPVGGGGLAAGMGIALRALSPKVELIGVQSSETRAMYDAFSAGGIVESPITPTIAEGLAGCTDATAYAWLRDLIDEIYLVPETSLAGEMRGLFNAMGVVAEGAAVVGIAAVSQGSVHLRGPTVVVVSGGNIDPARLAAILSA